MYFEEWEGLKVKQYPQEWDLLGVFEVRYVDYCIVLRFYECEDLNNNEKYGKWNKPMIHNKFFHHIYVIVRSIHNH